MGAAFAPTDEVLKGIMRYLHGFLCTQGFLDCNAILQAIPEDEPFDVHGARHVLARAPMYGDIIDDYGRLLARLLTHSVVEKGTFYIEADARLLADFLAAISTGAVASAPLVTEPESEADFAGVSFSAMDKWVDAPRQGLEFIRTYMRNFYQLEERQAAKAAGSTPSLGPTPLDELMASLASVDEAHPALVVAVSQHWVHPESILDYLANNAKGSEEPLLSTAFYELMAALRSVVALGTWKPQRPEHYNLLLLAHARRDNECRNTNIPWEEEFMRAMVHNHPEMCHWALNYLVTPSRALLNFSTLDAFFPLPLFLCSRRETLQQLAQLFVKEDVHGKTSGFFARLKQHHSELMDLLELHFSVYVAHPDAAAHSDAMLDAFEGICLGKPGSCTVNSIDSCLFE